MQELEKNYNKLFNENFELKMYWKEAESLF